jgi:hypothetical protein
MGQRVRSRSIQEDFLAIPRHAIRPIQLCSANAGAGTESAK